MKLLLTADRLRAIVSAAGTEKDLENTLRRHRIRFTWTTAPGYLAARVTCRSGSMLVYRSAARSAPFVVRSAPVAGDTGYLFPVPRYSWDD